MTATTAVWNILNC